MSIAKAPKYIDPKSRPLSSLPDATLFWLGVAVAVYAPVKIWVTVVYVPVGTNVPDGAAVIEAPE